MEESKKTKGWKIAERRKKNVKGLVQKVNIKIIGVPVRKNRKTKCGELKNHSEKFVRIEKTNKFLF